MRQRKAKRIVSFTMSLVMLLSSGNMVLAGDKQKAVGAEQQTTETVEIGSEVWETPYIPDEAVRVQGISESCINLNETTADGTWKFLFEIPDYTLQNGVPAPTASNQDFDFSKWDNMNWEKIKVPGEPLMQGFDILTNNEYYYQREITIPEDFEGSKMLVRFDGVYCNARVWIDGTYVRTHVGGFTTWDCDITPYVVPGETVTMTVGVADIYSSTKGIWNTEGQDMNNPSNATEYAHHNIGGINRDVSLIALPSDYIARTYIETKFDETFCNAELEVTAQLGMVSEKAVLKTELLDEKQVIADGEIQFSKPDKTSSGGGNTQSETMSDAVKLTMPITEPKKWDAEHPNLYVLRTTLLVDGKAVQVNEEKVGFREIYYGGKDGTDTNKIYVNGKEVKLRGTCRHDVSNDLGRSMTREECYAEIEAYKNANINYIRTSHYPPSEDLLDACDEYGIYVEEETAVCFQGYGSRYGEYVCSKYEDYMPQFTEMIERDRNRPSVLIWSLGNESNYTHVANQSGGNVFWDEKTYLRDMDDTRPCKFSFPETGEPWGFMDIYSKHYAEVTGNLGSESIPVLHDEYAHIACYNLDELQRDVNTRNFWGESIKKAWENIFMTDGALGGALWGGIDDVFYIPEGTNERWHSHSDGQTAGYGEWGSVLDAYLREKPEAYLTKKAYSPVRIVEEECFVQKHTLMIPVKNWFDHTNMNELEVEYTIENEVKRIPVAESIDPHREGIITIPDIPENVQEINLKFYTADQRRVDEYHVELAEYVYKFTAASEVPPVIDEKENKILVTGEEFEISFDKKTGLIENAVFGTEEKKLLTGGPYLHVTGTEMGVWIPDLEEGITAKIEGKYAVITLKGRYESGPAVIFNMKISGNGIIETQYELTSSPSREYGLSEVGISFDVSEDIESVSWDRDGLYSVYPEEHIGRNKGKALKVREGSDEIPDRYGVEPVWNWKDDMKNYFIYPTEDPDNGLVTNDFKTMRENVYYYNVNYGNENDPYISVESPKADVAARVEVAYKKDYVDDRNESIKYTGGWGTYESEADFSGTETYSTQIGDSCEFTFEGTGVRYIGAKQENTGKVKVYIDDELKAEIDTYSNLGNDLKQTVIYSIDDLKFGTHTIRLETSGGHANCIVVDAFDVLQSKEIKKTENAKLIINNQWYYPNLAWGNYTGIEGRLFHGSKGKAVIRLTDEIQCERMIQPFLEDVAVTAEGENLELHYNLKYADEFVETKIEWYRVHVGNPESKKELIEGEHDKILSQKGLEADSIFCVITLERKGELLTQVKSNVFNVKEESYRWYDIVDNVDLFTYAGENGKDYQTDRDEKWTQNAYQKTVTYLLDTENEAAVSFTFTGNEIRWIGAKEENQGIARVTVDDGEPVEVDLFGEGVTTENQISEILFSKSWENAGVHTIKIERTGKKHANATAANVSLDAFIVVNRVDEEHILTHHDAKEATCTESGNVEYWRCETCQKNFADEAGKEEVKDVTVSALGHQWSEELSHNETHHWYDCERCAAKKDEEEHTGGTATTDKKAVCEVCGAEYGDTLPEPPKKDWYDDVREGDWYYDVVADVSTKKLMTGLTDTHFGAADTIVRAQFATILYRMEGEPKVEYKKIFKDVPDNHFYSDAVTWAAEKGIIKGYENGSGLFGTNDSITREQMAAMMYRYAEYKKEDVTERADLDKFPDCNHIQAFAQEALKWCHAKGLIEGKTADGKKVLDPQGHANRAECAKIISFYTEVMQKKINQNS